MQIGPTRVWRVSMVVLAVWQYTVCADDASPGRIRVPEGYTVQRTAAPPLVAHPMMGAFDDRGRLYITESSGENLVRKDLEAKLPHSIRRLEDIDGDGTFDRATVFADKLTFPQGAVWHDGWLYSAVSGGVWRFADRDDDGVAEVRERLVDGFGYFGNAADIHGCFLHPSGRIYWVDGRQGHRATDPSGRLVSESRVAGGVFSMRADGTNFRQHATGGFANPVELVFTPAGQAIGTVNILYNNPRVDAIVHWVEGGVYPPAENLGAWGPFIMTGAPLAGAVSLGHVAVSGLTWWQGGPQDHHDVLPPLLVTFFNRHSVVLATLRPDGATYAGSFADFLVSDDIDFHPTDVIEDADGSVLVIDTGGWFSIGCPTSQLAKPQVKGAIYRVRRKDAAPLEDPRGLELQWAGARVDELVARLEDPRHAVRELALHELVRRGPEAVSSLARFMPATGADTKAAARLDALWALSRIDGDEARRICRAFLSDPDPTVRQAAAQVAGLHRDVGAAELLAGLLRDPHLPVRRESATALGLIGNSQAVPGLLETVLSPDTDRVAEHAMIYAVIQIDDPAATRPALDHPQSAVRRAALIALDQMASGRLTPEQVLKAMSADDRSERAAALEIFVRRKSWADHAAALLEQKLGAPAHASSGDSAEAEAILGAFIGEPTGAHWAAVALDAESFPSTSAVLVLRAMGHSSMIPPRGDWIRAIGRRIGSNDPAIAVAAIDATMALAIGDFDSKLALIISDAQADPAVRLAATRSLALRGRELNPAAFAILGQELAPHHPMERRRDAARMLAAASLTDAQLLALAPALGAAGPVELPLLLQCFARSSSPAVGQALLGGLSEAPARWSLDAEELEKITRRFGAGIPGQADPLLQELRTAAGQRESRLALLEKSSTTGDALRGRQVFMSRGTCFICHRVNGEGGTLGPDLSRIGAMRSSRDLVESIIFPSATIAQGYEAVTVPLTGGQTYFGRFAREGGEEFLLIDPQGIEHRLPTSQINFFAMKRSQTSLMPAGLDRLLTDTELADLIAYLESLR